MKILLVNDDGIDAKLYRGIGDYFERMGHCVYRFAPERNCSGFGNKVSWHQTVTVKTFGERGYAVEGTPTDCTLIGLQALSAQGIVPDAVISGINDGLNYGVCTNYSGTVAAAREAARCGVPGIAISMHPNLMGVDPADVYALAYRIVRAFLSVGFPAAYTLNVNIASARYRQIAFENEDADADFVFPRVESVGVGGNGYTIKGGAAEAEGAPFELMLGLIHRWSGFHIAEEARAKKALLFAQLQ